jgi:hypothetical protein
MRVLRRRSNLLLALLVITAQLLLWGLSLAQTQPVSILIVRHAESDPKHPNQPLSAIGRQRAELLASTVRGINFTHLFSSHTTRSRQMLEAIAAKQGLTIVQLPTPGTMHEGEIVTDKTTRRASMEPVATALLKLPPGSVALVSLNSENIFGIMNKLGVPVAPSGQSCGLGSMCVPCLENACYPRQDFDRIWHLVLEADRPLPLAFLELRYGVGWRSADQ